MNAARNERFGKVAVLMGGWSAEREISLRSGNAVLTSLQKQGIDAHGIDMGVDVIHQLATGRFDRAFVMVHGRGGEDGVIQGALEILRLPYTGSGVLGASVCMDKLMTKRIWLGAGLPTPGFVELYESTDAEVIENSVGFPCIVKPTLEGSSIGMTKVENPLQLTAAWKLASQHGQPVIAESWITGEEYTIAILGVDALPVIRLQTPRGFYDYEAKYQADDTQYHCPCGLPQDKERDLQTLALQAFAATAASGWGRVDIMVDKHDQSWLIEINTVPGMTDHSLVPMAAAAAGIDFDSLVVRILENSAGGA